MRSVALDGKLLPTSQLRAVIATRPGVPLDDGQLERDRKAMEHLLAELGYLAARVAPPVTTFDAAGAAYVTFEVDQGAMFHFGNTIARGEASRRRWRGAGGRRRSSCRSTPMWRPRRSTW